MYFLFQVHTFQIFPVYPLEEKVHELIDLHLFQMRKQLQEEVQVEVKKMHFQGRQESYNRDLQEQVANHSSHIQLYRYKQDIFLYIRESLLLCRYICMHIHQRKLAQFRKSYCQ